MSSRNYRPASPGSRRLVNPLRSSTGTLDPHDYEDPYYAPTRSSRDSLSGPRTSADRLLAPRTTTRTYRVEPPPPGRPQDDYTVSQRRSTLEPLSAATRRPLSVVLPTSNRYRPVISSAVEKPSSPYYSRPREEEPHYLLPASSSRRDHVRTYSADNTNIGQYLSDGRDRRERAGYRSSGVSGRGQEYHLNLPLVRKPKDEDDLGYEYTDRKEQMYRDTAPVPRSRRVSDAGRRERPHSIIGLEGYPTRTLARDAGPPVTTRGFDRLDRSGSLRHEYRIPKDGEAIPRDSGNNSNDERLKRHRSGRSGGHTVAVHQDRDEDYSRREDRKEPREKRGHEHHRHSSIDSEADGRGLGIRVPFEEDRRREDGGRSTRPEEHGSRKEHDDGQGRDRHHEDRDGRNREEPRKDRHRDSKLGEDLALGAAGVAAAGIVAEGIKERHRRDKSSDPNVSLPDRTRDRGDTSLAVIPDPSDASDDNRERRRRRQAEKEGQDGRDYKGNDRRERVDEYARPVEDPRQGSGSYEQTSRYAPQPGSETEDPRKSHSHHHHRTQDEDSYSESEGDRNNAHRRKSSRVRVVSPSKDERPEIKPKGILRPPREKFPEDPAPVREGVAPLKEAGKKGIPPNARWTKIDRRLVNPEALELGNERYEERIDYVIVLRVLTKEEIEAYAAKTQEIRGKRPPLAEDGTKITN
jgi:hypothetical protein